LLGLLLVGLCSCASFPEEPRGLAPRTYALEAQPRGSEAPRPQSSAKKDSLGPIQSSAMDVDYFQGLLVRAGVPPHALPRNGHRITPDEAMELLSWLLAAEVRLRDFGPWRMAAHLLWEVVHGEATVSRKELYERMRRFSGLLVLRPDGNLVRATTGEAVQFIDTVRLEEGALRAEGFEVGPFYTPRQGRFLYPVDGSLTVHPDARVAGVYMPEEGVLGPALEGVGQAVADSVTGIVSLVLHPVESLEGLVRLPSAVVLLIQHSPEFWEHFRSQSRGAQVRGVSRLLTNVLIICGTAQAGAARAVSAGSKLGRLGVPVLSVSANGTLALRRLVLPAEAMATAVSTGTGALYIVHMSAQGAGGGGGEPGGKSWRPPPGGPGKWVRKNEGMKPGARQYQCQVTGAPEGWVYRVERNGERFDFDGYKDGCLLDAKGPGYDNKFLKSLDPEPWFEDTGARELLQNAERQLRVANGTPVRWHVAEAKAAQAIRKLLERNSYGAIQIVHTPVLP
jgi:hypothetical protein